MNSKQIMQSDILDIIFENRNKKYGAYDLRKFYPGRLRTALSLMGLIALVFSIFLLLPQKTTIVRVVPYVFNDPVFTKVAETPKPPKDPEKPKETIKTESATQPVNQQKLLSDLKIVDDKTKTDSIPTLIEDAAIGSSTVTIPGAGTAIIKPVNTETGPAATEPATKPDRSTVIQLGDVDVPPVFPGGMEALRNFLRKHLNAPEPLNEGESVTVKVSFVVGYDGKLQRFKIVEDGGELFNKEVVRVLKKMPDWVPGKAKGENVSVYYLIPVKFTGAAD